MDKRKCIEEFLNYGGNELFSTLMHRGMKRSECVDRLVQLLQTYSDSCRRIKGRSAAYRFMLGNAIKQGWLGKESSDLKSHRLTRKEKELIIKKLDEYISSGGKSSRALNKSLAAAAVVIVTGLAVFGRWRYMQSEEYRRGTVEYFENQIAIENVKHSEKLISFSISTSESISRVYMEEMPKVGLITGDGETDIPILPQDDLSYSNFERELELIRLDSDDGFQRGEYRIVFSFYSYDGDGEKTYLPVITRTVIVN